MISIARSKLVQTFQPPILNIALGFLLGIMVILKFSVHNRMDVNLLPEKILMFLLLVCSIIGGLYYLHQFLHGLKKEYQILNATRKQFLIMLISISVVAVLFISVVLLR